MGDIEAAFHVVNDAPDNEFAELVAECEPRPSIACRDSCYSTASQYYPTFDELAES